VGGKGLLITPEGSMKLTVFSGQYFWFDGRNYSTDEAFVKFVLSFYPHFEKIIFCDAVRRNSKSQPYILDPKYTLVCPLPCFSLDSVWRSPVLMLPDVYRRVSHYIKDWDLVWLHGPHPVSFIIAHICRRFHKPFFLFIRQDLRAYVAKRNSGLKKALALLFASFLEFFLHRLTQDTLTFAVGKEIFDSYRGDGKPVRQVAVSLVSHRDIGRMPKKKGTRLGDPIQLLSIGRLSPEKGIGDLIEAVNELTTIGKVNVLLNIVGAGSEEIRLKLKVRNLELDQSVQFLGYVTHSQRLFDLYRTSDIFVLSSLTEGFPQTLFEAMACGIPIVATKVGGVPSLIEDEHNGLLVSPGSPTEICSAVLRLVDDSKLRSCLVRNGFATAKQHTMEGERDRMILTVKTFLHNFESRDP
jgi:glycosyltransferase involved in cell wall biosynthesis